MPRLGEKYLAGFLDADGSVGISWRGGQYKPQLTLSFSQKTSQDEVLHLIQQEIGGSMRVKRIGEADYSELSLRDKPAVLALSRIRKHLVLKRRYADVCLAIAAEGVPSTNWKDRAKQLKVERRIASLPLPVHPTRKWLAGYFDGDGCIYSKAHKHQNNVASIEISIAASTFDAEGITILQKAFGGKIYKHGESVAIWKLHGSPSKLEQFFSYFGKHSIVKKSQIDFALACARMGHLRDGENISNALKHLKSHPHRLNEPRADLSTLMALVRDIPKGVRGPAQAIVGPS